MKHVENEKWPPAPSEFQDGDPFLPPVGTMRPPRRKIDLIYLRPVIESAENLEYLREVALALLTSIELMVFYA